jgi:gamma-glutamyltranspeptidase/glutathione hydrolase
MNRNVEQWHVGKNAVSSERGVVAAQNWMAAAAGADAMAKGGNAIDAAVACAFALNVVEPWMCGMGGSGYAVIWLAQEKRATVIDFQGVLPNSIELSDYPLDPEVPESIMGFPGVVDQANVIGYRSITIPGAVSGLSLAQKHFGRLSFDRILSSAITLADRGLPVDWYATLQIALESEDLLKFTTSASTYLPAGAPPKPEQYLALGNLAKTLKYLSDNGPDEFYSGRIAELLAKDLQAGGSRITAEDLSGYSAKIIDPLVGEHRESVLYTAGKTSGGRRLHDSLEYVAKHLDLDEPFGAHTYEVYAKALNQAFRAHKNRLGRVDRVGCTSHMSVVDSDGNMVALTYTLLNRFGSKVMLPSTGMIMNNAASYFDPRPGFPATMAGGKRINSSNMCPTICVKDNEALFSIGASGANHIVPCTMQIAGFLLDYNFSLEKALNLPRIDASGRDAICVDPDVGENILEKLGNIFNLEVAQNLVFPKLYACPSAVYRDVKTSQTFGCSDKSNPAAGAVAEAEFTIEKTAIASSFSPRA